METINIGNVVCLKSNKSVRMTVRWIEEQDGVMMANCDWFVDKKLMNETFPLTSLTTDTCTTSFAIV
jgi:hypothetical protein